ncbi:MAG: SDR family oxidoreductase [Thermodesulfobacteriota bacterium]
MLIDLKGKSGIITGGGHGIGRAYCIGMAKAGAKVVAADIDFDAAQETIRLVEEGGGEGIAVQVDVADELSTTHMAQAAIKAYGQIDFLVNNAAVFATIPISRVPFDEVSLDEWDRLMNVNLKGTWLCCRAVAPQMKKQKSGKIINISSGSVYSGTGMRIHYVTSKAGIIGFTRTLARELGDYNITVNALAPGSTLSEKPEDPNAIEYRKKALGKRCLKRLQFPEDLVGTMVFLCSNASDFMTGQTMVVDGGAMMI